MRLQNDLWISQLWGGFELLGGSVSRLHHYMTKPIDIDALSKLLAELIGGKKVDAPVQKPAPVAAIAPDQPQADTPVISPVAAPQAANPDQPLIFNQLVFDWLVDNNLAQVNYSYEKTKDTAISLGVG